MAAPTPTNISILRAGTLDRKIQILGVTFAKVKGEARPTYSQILSIPAAKEPSAGGESVKAGAVTNVGTVTWRIRYNTQIIVETPNYEALRVAEVIDAPVYLLDLGGQIMYDLFGNPLVALDDEATTTYDIKDVTEVGRRIAMDLICERWR